MTTPKNQVSWAQVVLSLGSLAVVFVGAGLLLWLLFRGISAVTPYVTRADLPVIATLFVGLLGFIGVLVAAVVSYRASLAAKREERLREIEQELRKQKAPAYEEFVKFLFKMLVATEVGKEISQKEMLEFVRRFNEKMIVWGGDEVLKAWSLFKLGTEHANGFEALYTTENILFAIRADMGHSNTNLRQGDLLAQMLKDAHTVIPEERRIPAGQILTELRGK